MASNFVFYKDWLAILSIYFLCYLPLTTGNFSAVHSVMPPLGD